MGADQFDVITNDRLPVATVPAGPWHEFLIPATQEITVSVALTGHPYNNGGSDGYTTAFPVEILFGQGWPADYGYGNVRPYRLEPGASLTRQRQVDAIRIRGAYATVVGAGFPFAVGGPVTVEVATVDALGERPVFLTRNPS